MELEKKAFSNEELIQWRSTLEKRKLIVLAAEANLKRHATEELSAEGSGEISRVRLHSGDLATNTQELETLETLSVKNIKSVQDIDDAMIRIDRGTFGLCLNCGESISVARLKAVPESKYCIDCQQDLERTQETTAQQRFPANAVLPQALLKSLEILGKISVADIMQENPITLRFNESLDTAIELMTNNKVRHLLVVDDKGDIQGVLSDRDWLGVVISIRPSIVSQRVENMWGKTKVSQIMTKVPEIISPESSLFDAGTMMLENKISCLPVVEGNHLVGIITESDFVKLITQGILENA